MNLQPVSTGANPLSYVCYRCERRVNHANEAVYADLDGEPFKAYYCEPCKKIVKKED